jgi:transcriptional regulator with XRE-family HTH domain
VGSRIRKARKMARPQITQLDLVARLQSLGLSIDQSTLSKIENGQRPVTDIEIAALAKALKVSVNWLFDEDNQSPSSSNKGFEKR